MPLNAQQIVAQACEIAKVPNYTTQAGQKLNLILQELCQTYNVSAARKTTVITLSTGTGVGTLGQGSGPYLLPDDYLRLAKNEAIYRIDGVPYSMINIDLQAFDNLVQQAGISNYPEMFATDTSDDAVTTWGSKVMYVWPPSGGVYQPQLRYWSLMPEIDTPELSTVVPWFPNTNYLITRLAGELMKTADDARTDTYLGDTAAGAQGILNRYLKLHGDDESRVKTVELDRRRFGKSFSRLPQTKTLGW
jgi:hypothetical protein